MTRGDNLLTAGGDLQTREIDQLDLCESVQILGDSARASSFKLLPRYGEMLERVRESAGLDAKDFRLFRLHVKYPVISLMYGVFFPVPARPVTPFYGGNGGR